ncbi:MAG: hypothetical protein P4L72_16950 [Parvibaculum sp.]|uniref:hypothetical protein n=1 Tax=Parvibaculum sp. TaxID=2024848 RepID=UPI0028435C65|nr:hypothetical protein [Parvibaculum sp.]MDR3500904.1 hypothetical protein [Parvibaculum sp.]
MHTINRIEDVSADVVSGYNGFLTCLLYTTAHTEFRKMIMQQWDALDSFSDNVLILVADHPEQSAPVSKPSPHNLQTGGGSAGTIHMITSLPGFVAGQTDKTNAKALKHYGISRSLMPCIVFFNDPLSSTPTTITYSFRGIDRPLVDDFMDIFEKCSSVWSEPSANERNDLAGFRARKMIELEPLINRLQFLQFAGKVVKNAAFASLLALIGKIVI